MKFLDAKEARYLMTGQSSQDRSLMRQILLQKHIDKLKEQIYSEIEKEARRGKAACCISVSKNKQSVERQAVAMIREDLRKQGYDTLIERGFFSSTLYIAW